MTDITDLQTQLTNLSTKYHDVSDSNKLLKKQQDTSTKLNELLEKSTQSLLCGPECQKTKITAELKQKYLDAQTNLQTAPIQLEETKRNYYVYSEGQPAYNNMLEDDLQKKSDKIVSIITEEFNAEIANATTMNSYYDTEVINSRAIRELYASLVSKNKALELKLRNRHGDILTNDRKTYYETEAHDKLSGWYSFWLIIYYILYIVLLLSLVLVRKNPYTRSIGITLLVVIGVGLYPFYINWIVMYIYGLLRRLYNMLPVNVYNNL